MKCWIYKGRRATETYLYLAEENGLHPVPEALLAGLGPLELVMELDLHHDRSLARANPRQVMRALTAHGYYLQLPPIPDPGAERMQ